MKFLPRQALLEILKTNLNEKKNLAPIKLETLFKHHLKRNKTEKYLRR